MSARNAKLSGDAIHHDTLNVLRGDCASSVTAPRTGGWGGGWGGWTSCQFENPPPGLTFVIFILLIFPPIPCECTQKGGCQLPPQCVQRYEEKKYSGRFNSGGAILAENTDRLLRLVAKVCRDVTVKSMRKTMTCGDKCPPALCRGFFFARGLSLV